MRTAGLACGPLVLSFHQAESEVTEQRQEQGHVAAPFSLPASPLLAPILLALASDRTCG